MKKFILAVAFIILGCNVASAQQKGDMYIGGQIGVTVQSVTSDGYSESATAFSIQPEFGYFVANRCKVGLSVGYGISADVHSLTICPNFSYYLPLCDGLYYTQGIELGYAMGKTEGISMSGLGAALHAFSLEFRPTKHFGFTANILSFNVVALNNSEYNFSSTAVNCNIGMNPTIGFKYYF